MAPALPHFCASARLRLAASAERRRGNRSTRGTLHSLAWFLLTERAEGVQVSARLREAGLKRQRLAKLRLRLRGPPKLHQGETEIVACLRVARLERHRVLEVREGLLHPPLTGQRDSEIRVRTIVVG